MGTHGSSLSLAISPMQNGCAGLSAQNEKQLPRGQGLLRIMPANNTGGIIHWLSGRVPGSIGHLYTPVCMTRPKRWLPYALDNGAFALAVKGLPFDDAGWDRAIEHYAHHDQPPTWAVVPDVPFFATETIARWNEDAPKLSERYPHIPLALAVQDGMTPDDVRGLELQPSVIFIGGTTEWKWATVPLWCREFLKVHVARVNGRRGLDICAEHGADSCDGSGWMRGRDGQLMELMSFVADQHGLDLHEFKAAVRSIRHATDMQKVLGI